MVVLEVICRRVDPRDPSALITTQLLYGMGRRVLLPCWLACHQGHITPRHWIMRLPKPPRWCQQERAVHPISVCDCRRTYLDTDPDVQKSSQPLSPTTCHEAQVYQTSSFSNGHARSYSESNSLRSRTGLSDSRYDGKIPVRPSRPCFDIKAFDLAVPSGAGASSLENERSSDAAFSA